MRNYQKYSFIFLLLGLLCSTVSFADNKKTSNNIDPEVPIVFSAEPPPPPPTIIASATGGKVLTGPTPQSADDPFTKNTDSPIFWLLKSWKCDNFDGKTFLRKAVLSYGETANDKFQVRGLENLSNFKASFDKKEIKLDELLDEMAKEYGFIWGVDVPGKSIFFSTWTKQK